MQDKHSNARRVIVATLVLLPLLYVASYFAMVLPDGSGDKATGNFHYRFGGRNAEMLFWPLEQLDRRIRPDAWQDVVWESFPPLSDFDP